MEDRKKILIVDDVFQVRFGLTQFFTRSDYDVFEADSGISALDIFDEYKPDLIITDYNLRDMNCFQLLAAVRKYENNLKDVVKINNVPAIIISGYLHKEDILITKKQLGVCGFLRKPIILGDLLTEVEKALGDSCNLNLNSTKEVIICDSEIRSARYIAQFLQQNHFSTNACSSYFDFTHLAKAQEPDLVIFDCFLQLPSTSESNLFKFCQNINPSCEIFLTTYHKTCKLQNTYNLFGARHIFPKPIDLDYLVETANQLFKERELKGVQTNSGNFKVENENPIDSLLL